ncbi:hypothetical protein LCGC14_0386910 [marine sediment metagenome]|uniref:DNA methylase N-4/N-6 domain-containing protein n=1 Tax=marine sediment metagenome TaxID=412755 RepID=A0A0F9W9N7_9ZZZZ
MTSVTLFHGDCLDILPTLTDGSVDVVITDPPYGIGYHDGSNRGRMNMETKWVGRKISGDNYPNTDFLSNAFDLIIDGGAIYMFSHWRTESVWKHALEKVGFVVRNRIIWIKSHFGAGDLKTTYGPQHESIYFATKGRHELHGKRCGDVWKDNLTSCIRSGKVHPTEKPVEIIAKAIEKSSNPGDIILDPFMGSGTTGVACMQTDRNFIGIEISEDYFNIAQKRIAEARMQPVLLDTNNVSKWEYYSEEYLYCMEEPLIAPQVTPLPTLLTGSTL